MIWVLLVLALLVGLLAVPWRGEVLWRSASLPRITVRWLFLKARVFPRPEKKTEKTKKSEKQKASPGCPQAGTEKTKKENRSQQPGTGGGCIGFRKRSRGFPAAEYPFL